MDQQASKPTLRITASGWACDKGATAQQPSVAFPDGIYVPGDETHYVAYSSHSSFAELEAFVRQCTTTLHASLHRPPPWVSPSMAPLRLRSCVCPSLRALTPAEVAMTAECPNPKGDLDAAIRDAASCSRIPAREQLRIAIAPLSAPLPRGGEKKAGSSGGGALRRMPSLKRRRQQQEEREVRQPACTTVSISLHAPRSLSRCMHTCPDIRGLWQEAPARKIARGEEEEGAMEEGAMEEDMQAQAHILDGPNAQLLLCSHHSLVPTIAGSDQVVGMPMATMTGRTGRM